MTTVLGIAAPTRGADRPNVILISLDTVRADRLGAYGYSRKTTPRLDAFAADGVLFENVVSAASWTLPSHMSMFTSLYPPRHGVTQDLSKLFILRANLDQAWYVWRSTGWRGLLIRYAKRGRLLNRDIRTLPELFKARGYRTGGFAATDSLKGNYGFARGFDVYDNADSRPGPEQIRLALAWAARRSKKPLFLFLHLFDAHSSIGADRGGGPNNVPIYGYGGAALYRPLFDDGRRSRFHGSPWELNFLYRRGLLDRTDIRTLNAMYDSGVRYEDSMLGEFLDGLKRLGLYDSSVILLTSDHGEGLMVEHPLIIHGNSLYRELVHVPMILKLPRGGPTGLRVPGLARTVDYLPTLLEAAGIPAPAGICWDGASLLPRVRGRGAPAAEAYSETRVLDEAPAQYALERSDGLKAVYRPHANSLELYDLRRDPSEARDLSALRPELAGAMQESILRYSGDLAPDSDGP